MGLSIPSIGVRVGPVAVGLGGADDVKAKVEAQVEAKLEAKKAAAHPATPSSDGDSKSAGKHSPTGCVSCASCQGAAGAKEGACVPTEKPPKPAHLPTEAAEGARKSIEEIAAKAMVPSDPAAQLELVKASLSRSETGAALLAEAEASGLIIEYSDEPKDEGAAAWYTGDKIQISPDYADRPADEVVGVLAHELGHFAMDQHGVLEDLERMPGKTEHLANEIISESLAVTITSEAGIERSGTGVANADGSLRTYQDAIKSFLEDDGYVEYYDVDVDSLSSADIELIQAATAYHGDALIRQYGSPNPQLDQGIPEEDPLARDDFGFEDLLQPVLPVLNGLVGLL